MLAPLPSPHTVASRQGSFTGPGAGPWPPLEVGGPPQRAPQQGVEQGPQGGSPEQEGQDKEGGGGATETHEVFHELLAKRVTDPLTGQ